MMLQAKGDTKKHARVRGPTALATLDPAMVKGAYTLSDLLAAGKAESGWLHALIQGVREGDFDGILTPFTKGCEFSTSYPAQA